MSNRDLRSGDFTGLAEDYSQSRPDYSPSVLAALVGLLESPFADIDVADIGAGTGIWTRMVQYRGPRSLVAVEPNDDMRAHGIRDSADLPIKWVAGSAETTGLADASCDWVTMASSFHWVEFDAGVREFHRILRSGGRFTAVWNPRLTETNPLLVEIEDQLKSLCPHLRRVSSGRSGITETLTDRLLASRYFEDVVQIEGRHTIDMPPDRYISAWRSVNDVRVQMGAELFERFLAYLEVRLAGLASIEATYLTRAWSARRKQ
jgi:ubiquinone/menaquinone biosynthesis C-methylase UbiE